MYRGEYRMPEDMAGPKQRAVPALRPRGRHAGLRVRARPGQPGPLRRGGRTRLGTPAGPCRGEGLLSLCGPAGAPADPGVPVLWPAPPCCQRQGGGGRRSMSGQIGVQLVRRALDPHRHLQRGRAVAGLHLGPRDAAPAVRRVLPPQPLQSPGRLSF